MATVKEILDRASDITGLRKTGSERVIALQALEDVYLDVCTELALQERLYVHTLNNNLERHTLPNFNDLDSFTRVNDEVLVFPTSTSSLQLANSPINPSGVVVSRLAGGLGAVYTEGTDYTLDRSTGLITSLTLPNTTDNPGDDQVFISYFTVPIASGNADILLPPFIRIRNITFDGAGLTRYPLKQISGTEYNHHDIDVVEADSPMFYTMSGTSAIRVYPRSVGSGSFNIHYVPMPPALSEDDNVPPALWDEAIWDLSKWDDYRGTESQPSHVPVQFHWNTLLPGVVVQLLDKDQRTDDVQAWMQRYEYGLARVRRWKKTMGGSRNPTVFNAGRDDNPYRSNLFGRYSRGR